MLSQTEPRDHIVRWIIKLSDFYIQFEHIAGVKNEIADVLSRGVLGDEKPFKLANFTIENEMK